MHLNGGIFSPAAVYVWAIKFQMATTSMKVSFYWLGIDINHWQFSEFSPPSHRSIGTFFFFYLPFLMTIWYTIPRDADNFLWKCLAWYHSPNSSVNIGLLIQGSWVKSPSGVYLLFLPFVFSWICRAFYRNINNNQRRTNNLWTFEHFLYRRGERHNLCASIQYIHLEAVLW